MLYNKDDSASIGTKLIRVLIFFVPFRSEVDMSPLPFGPAFRGCTPFPLALFGQPLLLEFGKNGLRFCIAGRGAAIKVRQPLPFGLQPLPFGFQPLPFGLAFRGCTPFPFGFQPLPFNFQPLPFSFAFRGCTPFPFAPFGFQPLPFGRRMTCPFTSWLLDC